MRAPEAVYAGAVFPGFEEEATIMGRLDYDAEKVTVKYERSQELIGKKVKAGHVVLPADKYSMGEKLVPLFNGGIKKEERRPGYDTSVVEKMIIVRALLA